MFTINQGFDLNSPQFNFKRDYFASVANLKAAPETSFPDHFITNVAGVLYQLTKSNSVDATTGKWRKVKLGSDVDLSNYATKNEAIVSSTIESDKNSVSIYFGKGDDSQINYDIPNASNSSAGVITATDKVKLDGIAVGANKYVLPTATTAALGGIKTNYTNNGKNYKVDVDSNGNAYVNVPWTDTKTDISKCVTLTSETQAFDGNKELQADFNSFLCITAPGSNITSKFNFSKEGFNVTTGNKVLLLSGKGIASLSPTTGAVVGSSSELFATDGSIFNASTLATNASVEELRDNVIKNKGVTKAEDGTTIQANTFKITGTSSNTSSGVKFASNSLTVYDNTTENNQSVIISNTGIKTANNASASTFFATNGSTQSITAISTEELNKILV